MKRTQHRRPVIAPDASRFRLRIGRSRIQGWGVFAAQTIPPRRKVVEYIGERFTRRRLEKRLQKILNRQGRKPRYIFRLNPDWYVDGAIGGSGAERINHSCDPNLKTRKIRDHILYISRRRISPGEELTVDYRYRPEGLRRVCRCHSPKCRGTINLLKRPSK